MSQPQHSLSEKRLASVAGKTKIILAFPPHRSLAFLFILVLLNACLFVPPPPTPGPPPPLTITSTSTPFPVPSPTFTPSLTPIPETESFVIGYSVQGRPITVTRLGTGEDTLVVIGAIHGFEGNSARLVEALMQGLAGKIPASARVYFIPTFNADGYANGTRLDANGVDLNRNWDTSNWERDTCYGEGNPVTGGGGAYPFSEPETAALSTWLLALNAQSSTPPRVISYHAYHEGGLVLPGYLTTGTGTITYPPAAEFGRQFASASGYAYSEIWPYCPMTGELSNWCAENTMACLLVELHTDRDLTAEEIGTQGEAILRVLRK